MRVLVAADGSSHGMAALRTACRILSLKDSIVDVICIAPRVHPKRAGLQNRLVRHATGVAEAAVRQLARDGVVAKPVVRTGSPAGVLVGCSTDYELTVVSAQSNREGSSAGIGPVASRVLNHAACSVLLARSGGEPPVKILIPADGSGTSLEAVTALGGMVDLRSAETTLVHVVETPWIRPVDDQEWIAGEEEPDEESELEEEFGKEAEAIIEQARDRLPPTAAVRTMIFDGLPAEEILAEANSGEYSLIALASTGGHDLKHRILGSVSGKVAWNAPCSVILIR